MCHAMQTIHKWGMFLHNLGYDTILHLLENNNYVSPKTNKFIYKVYFIQTSKFHLTFHNMKEVRLLKVAPLHTLQVQHN